MLPKFVPSSHGSVTFQTMRLTTNSFCIPPKKDGIESPSAKTISKVVHMPRTKNGGSSRVLQRAPRIGVERSLRTGYVNGMYNGNKNKKNNWKRIRGWKACEQGQRENNKQRKESAMKKRKWERNVTTRLNVQDREVRYLRFTATKNTRDTYHPICKTTKPII